MNELLLTSLTDLHGFSLLIGAVCVVLATSGKPMLRMASNLLLSLRGRPLLPSPERAGVKEFQSALDKHDMKNQDKFVDVNSHLSKMEIELAQIRSDLAKLTADVVKLADNITGLNKSVGKIGTDLSFISGKISGIK